MPGHQLGGACPLLCLGEHPPLAGWLMAAPGLKCRFFIFSQGLLLLLCSAREQWDGAVHAQSSVLCSETKENMLKTYSACNTQCGHAFNWRLDLSSYKEVYMFLTTSLQYFLGNGKDMVLTPSPKL